MTTLSQLKLQLNDEVNILGMMILGLKLLPETRKDFIMNDFINSEVDKQRDKIEVLKRNICHVSDRNNQTTVDNHIISD